jgi:beta-lactamase class A
MQRREALAVIAAGALSPFLTGTVRFSGTHPPTPDFATIERQVAGRLGVAALDVATRRRLTYRASERFPMCSTYKWLLAAQVLSLTDAGQEHLSRVIPYSQPDLLDHAPVTRAHVSDGGMPLLELLAAAIQHSDNTAANLLLRAVGGPFSLTTFLRHLGDTVTRLDRTEPALNSAVPGDVRDTTTPNAMVADMETLLTDNRLRRVSRTLLLNWLAGNTTGDDKLRAGLPKGWRIGDKTGAGAHGTTNDVAIVWPSPQRPVLVAAYLTETIAPVPVCNRALAAIGRAVATWVGDA